jgi:MFS family permease
VEAAEQATRADREAKYKRQVESNLPRNYRASFLHGMLGLTGFRLIYAPTIIPAYVHQLTGSAALVGLGQALLQFGAILSPIVGAARIEHRKRILPYAVRVGALMRLQILGLALAGWLLAGLPLLIATLSLFFLLGVFTGTQRVAFQMLVAKVIPIDLRGRLQAWRNVTGGIIAAGLAYVAGAYFIDANVLGNGYSTTFLLAFLLTSLGLLALQALLVEPDALSIRPQLRVLDRVRDFPHLLADRDYRWFIISQALIICGRGGMPFYILYAGERMGLGGGTIGLLSFAFLTADTLSNIVWGYLGDRFGFRICLLGSVATWIVAVALLLGAESSLMFVISFAGLGAAASGYMMSSATIVLEFGEGADLPMRLALSTTVEGAVAAIAPLAGGLIVTSFGFGALLICSLVLLIGALVLILLKVREPRNRPRSIG